MACSFRLETTNSGEPLKLFVVHWPSRLHPNGKENRRRAAQRLRAELEEPLSNGEVVAVMGDFNDEPFDSLERELDAVRDMAIVRRRPRETLFNPFWRELGHRSVGHEVSGTCRHMRGDTTTWRTFDQILLSHSLVCGASRVAGSGAAVGAFDAAVMPAWSDHLPVYVDIEANRT